MIYNTLGLTLNISFKCINSAFTCNCRGAIYFVYDSSKVCVFSVLRKILRRNSILYCLSNRTFNSVCTLQNGYFSINNVKILTNTINSALKCLEVCLLSVLSEISGSHKTVCICLSICLSRICLCKRSLNAIIKIVLANRTSNKVGTYRLITSNGYLNSSTLNTSIDVYKLVKRKNNIFLTRSSVECDNKIVIVTNSHGLDHTILDEVGRINLYLSAALNKLNLLVLRVIYNTILGISVVIISILLSLCNKTINLGVGVHCVNNRLVSLKSKSSFNLGLNCVLCRLSLKSSNLALCGIHSTLKSVNLVLNTLYSSLTSILFYLNSSSNLSLNSALAIAEVTLKSSDSSLEASICISASLSFSGKCSIISLYICSKVISNLLNICLSLKVCNVGSLEIIALDNAKSSILFVVDKLLVCRSLVVSELSVNIAKFGLSSIIICLDSSIKISNLRRSMSMCKVGNVSLNVLMTLSRVVTSCLLAIKSVLKTSYISNSMLLRMSVNNGFNAINLDATIVCRSLNLISTSRNTCELSDFSIVNERLAGYLVYLLAELGSHSLCISLLSDVSLNLSVVVVMKSCESCNLGISNKGLTLYLINLLCIKCSLNTSRSALLIIVSSEAISVVLSLLKNTIVSVINCVNSILNTINSSIILRLVIIKLLLNRSSSFGRTTLSSSKSFLCLLIDVRNYISFGVIVGNSANILLKILDCLSIVADKTTNFLVVIIVNFCKSSNLIVSNKRVTLNLIYLFSKLKISLILAISINIDSLSIRTFLVIVNLEVYRRSCNLTGKLIFGISINYIFGSSLVTSDVTKTISLNLSDVGSSLLVLSKKLGSVNCCVLVSNSAVRSNSLLKLVASNESKCSVIIYISNRSPGILNVVARRNNEPLSAIINDGVANLYIFLTNLESGSNLVHIALSRVCRKSSSSTLELHSSSSLRCNKSLKLVSSDTELSISSVSVYLIVLIFSSNIYNHTCICCLFCDKMCKTVQRRNNESSIERLLTKKLKIST